MSKKYEVAKNFIILVSLLHPPTNMNGIDHEFLPEEARKPNTKGIPHWIAMVHGYLFEPGIIIR